MTHCGHFATDRQRPATIITLSITMNNLVTKQYLKLFSHLFVQQQRNYQTKHSCLNAVDYAPMQHRWWLMLPPC